MEVTVVTRPPTGSLDAQLLGHIEASADDNGMESAILFYDFPLYRDELDGSLIKTPTLLLSRNHGVVLLTTSESVSSNDTDLNEQIAEAERLIAHIFSRLLKNPALRLGATKLNVPINAAIYAPAFASNEIVNEIPILYTLDAVDALLRNLTAPLHGVILDECKSTIEGAKGVIRPTTRSGEGTKGALAKRLEAEIISFDRNQRSAALGGLQGPHRIRGLAGSGKTVILAMKAANLHLRHPDRRILYTFWTKSLYQHVKTLITRFYRQFDDRDPDWELLQVRHGWGSSQLPGVYSMACSSMGVRPLSFKEAMHLDGGNPFDAACNQLLQYTVKPMFDYVLIDEGQDFPLSFMRLSARLVEESRFTIAYDELQNIFQTKSPSSEEIFGRSPDGAALRQFESDQVLSMCYRNPREVLVAAHAIGFGIYGNRISQMLENKAHWEDIGYKVRQGDFSAGSYTSIERPEENSLLSISEEQSFEEIISVISSNGFDEEVNLVCKKIQQDIQSGLRPDDILVVTVDDRNAKTYLQAVAAELRVAGIKSWDIHSSYGRIEFREAGMVTLSTVHKAKGNESMSVYVMGIDSLFPQPSVRRRNMLFTAMTRAKAWVTLSGTGARFKDFLCELEKARDNFPRLEFQYPSGEALSVMRRDLKVAKDNAVSADALFASADSLSKEEREKLLRYLLDGGVDTQGPG